MAASFEASSPTGEVTAPPSPFGWLESDDVVEGTLAAWHLAVGQPAVEAFELLEARDALHHFGTRQRQSRQRFHRFLHAFARSFDRRSSVNFPTNPGSRSAASPRWCPRESGARANPATRARWDDRADSRSRRGAAGSH